MPNKKNILIFIDWFTPGFKAGGPIKSVTNVINALYLDFNFYVITSDRDIGDIEAYQNLTLNEWIKNDKYSIIYLTPENRVNWIKKHLVTKEYHHYYFNSIFSKDFSITPLLVLRKLNLSNKAILAPRGMLGEGALSIKPLKKMLFLKLAKTLNYYNNIIWHATNQEELNDIINIFGKKIKSKVASNISFNNLVKQSLFKEKDNVKLVFFSRISPKKNLYYTLDLIKDINGVELFIYGIIEDKSYWKKCELFIKQHNINAYYKGELYPTKVQSTLTKYHFFILPTLHENYGHVIVEALVSGCGLIISDNTPWSGLKNKKIGWDIPLAKKENYIAIIEYCKKMGQEEYDSYRNNCYTFVENEVNNIKEIEATKSMFNE